MSTTLAPRQIFDYALLILEAARPPLRVLSPDATEEERLHHAQELWEEDSYDDPCLSLFTEHATYPDGREATELCIHLRDDSGELYDTGFVAYGIYTSEDADDPYSAFDVEQFTPGPWCDHLVTLVHRAAAVLNAREANATATS